MVVRKILKHLGRVFSLFIFCILSASLFVLAFVKANLIAVYTVIFLILLVGLFCILPYIPDKEA